ncbi:serine hydrolase domain-containing protein [Taklimakanibacter lacteus]|uniref:serine hydrolase domain-containing protein n=1 Tax=Taklimakanibacter lacteus TaxID=2268456 RepID=UPI000E66B61B
MRSVLAALFLGYAITVPTWSVAAETCGASVAAQMEWPTATPEQAGFDTALLCSIDATLDRSPQMKIHAVVVIRRGKLVYETYRPGDDNEWRSQPRTMAYSAQVKHDMYSVSKSVVSLLAGIAIDRRHIASVEEPLFAFYTDSAALQEPRKVTIRLRHLLTMTSGLAWDEVAPYDDDRNDQFAMIRSVNPYRFVLAKPLQHEPGARWNYSGGDTQLLGGIVQRTTRKFLADFAKEALFDPLGITDFQWMKMPANGEFAADSGLRLRPRDMAKIGQLVLDKGMWNGRRIVSREWIDEATRTHVTGFNEDIPSLGYGYQWWTDHGKVGDRDISWVSAQGHGGQRLYVVPAFDLVVAIAAGLYGEESQDWVSFDILDKFVLAAIRN